jgi:hypothetical protein
MELASNEVNHENVGPDRDEENNCILSASTFPASPHCIMNRDMLHCGCLILPRELGEVWHFKSGREWYLIVARWIRCPVHAGLLLRFYPILLL